MSFSKARFTKAGTPIPTPSRYRASSKKVSRCSRTTRWITVSSGERGRYPHPDGSVPKSEISATVVSGFAVAWSILGEGTAEPIPGFRL